MSTKTKPDKKKYPSIPGIAQEILETILPYELLVKLEVEK